MNIILEYKYFFLIGMIVLAWIVAQFINLTKEISFLDYNSAIETQFLKIQNFAFDLEWDWKLKTVKDVFVNSNWKLRWTKETNILFWKKLATSANEIEIMTWYNKDNPYYFTWKKLDNITPLDLDWNWIVWESSDKILVAPANKFNIKLIDESKNILGKKKTALKDIDLTKSWLINKWWWIDSILYVFENEEIAKKLLKDVLVTWTLVYVDDWYWVEVKAWILMDFLWQSNKIIVDSWQAPPKNCIYWFWLFWCMY